MEQLKENIDSVDINLNKEIIEKIGLFTKTIQIHVRN